VALVSLGTTPGLRHADGALAEQLRAAGLACEVREVRIGAAGSLRRNPAITDLVEALAARRAARGPEARVTLYSTVTAALLQPSRGPYAVRFDSPAALNRPGLSGAWQRARERWVLGRAKLLLPWSRRAADSAPTDVPRLVVPVPVPAQEPAGTRDIDVLAYAGYPQKRGLDVICRAWAQVGAGRTLVVGGVEREPALAWLAKQGVAEPRGVDWRGLVPRSEWLETVGRARLFVNASRWEDYGLSQLEALSAGAALVTVPSPGPYEALSLARSLAPELVDSDLEAALGAGLRLGEDELAAYRARAADALAPYRPDAVQAIVSDELLPALGFGR